MSTKVVVVQDEWYGWAATDTSPTEARGSEVVLDVDRSTARRWQKAADNFVKTMEEIRIAVQWEAALADRRERDET